MPLCNAKKTPLRRPVSGGLYALALLGSLTLLTSCSDSWPEALDPSDWYASTVGEEAAPTSDEPVPGADEDYPNLAEVPEAPTNVSSPEQIDQVAQSLAADLANAQYTTDLQRADDETAPEPMPIAQPEVVEVETETTYIEPGGEIEIAEAEAVAIVEPEAEVVAEEVAEVEPVAEAPAASDVAAATQAAATDVEAVAMAVAMEDSAAEAEGMALASGQLVLGETRIEQQTVVDNGTGDLIGSVTRTVEVVKVVQQAPAAPPAEEVVVVEEPAMTFTEVAETLEPVAEPAIAPAAADVPSATVAQTTGVTTSVETLDFTDLFAASGPGAGTPEQPLVVASADTQVATQAAFTTVGLPAPETLAAIIRFGDGSSALGAVERDIVRQLAAIHAERGGTIRLVGHASRAAGGMETGSQELVNFNISLDRATAVAAELIRQGVPSSVVVVEAAGDSQASADAAQDRRVDVLFGA